MIDYKEEIKPAEVPDPEQPAVVPPETPNEPEVPDEPEVEPEEIPDEDPGLAEPTEVPADPSPPEVTVPGH